MNTKTIPKVKRVMTVVSALVAIGFVFPTWTPRIHGRHSISELKHVKINGTGHEVMIRGVDRRNPIVIFVHGGPGSSQIPFVRKYQQLLERDFTIVHYDQRGSGKSYHFFEDYSNLTIDLLVADLLALTDYVAHALGQRKVLLVGHSFGTYIGMKAASKAPDKFAAYIGIGQIADSVTSELDSLNYCIAQAKLKNQLKNAESLERLRGPIERGERLTPKGMIRKYGGAARLIDDRSDYYRGFLFNPEYHLLDVARYLIGYLLSQKMLLEEESQHNLTKVVRRLDIPLYFVMGQFDYITSVNAARAFFQTLQAPVKEFVVFNKSAHYPQFEEEELFAAWLKKTWSQLENG